MIKSKDLPFFKNLSQFEYEIGFFDLHNDFDCEKVSLNTSKVLSIIFKRISDKEPFELTFSNVNIEILEFFNVKDIKNLTIDNLYRGRFERKGELLESLEDGRGFFYMEFYEGQKLEFWSSGVEFSKQNNTSIL